MTLIGQPESYSDVLTRVFVASLTTGILCTFALASASPPVQAFLDGFKPEAEIGILKGVKALYVLIPMAVALASRAVLLHDKISNVFGIRERFDLNYILRPLAEGVDLLPTAENGWNYIEGNRKRAMARTFYPYCSFLEPKIDKQLVRTAADRWAWFWSAVEPQAILGLAGIGFIAVGAWEYLLIVALFSVALLLIARSLLPKLRSSAQAQVDEILHNGAWRAEVRRVFVELGLKG